MHDVRVELFDYEAIHRVNVLARACAKAKVMKARAILASLSGALRGGGVQPAPHLDIRTDVRELTIEHTTPFPYQLDGDALGETTKLDFVHVPDAVKLVFPKLG